MMMLLQRCRGAAALVLVSALLASLAPVATAPASAAPASAGERPSESVVGALDRVAEPLASTEPSGSLRDLRPFGRMVGGAGVVGVGEATHNSREFFTAKHRLFRYLVRSKGFRAFSLEIGWSTGLRIDEYLRTGNGDLRRIMRREFRGIAPWQTEEFFALFRWMRAYNVRHPDRPLRFVGNDLNYPTLGTELVSKVRAYVRAHHPELLPRFDALYRDFEAVPDGPAFMARPLAERRSIAADTRRAYDLLARHPGPDQEAFAWVLQHARSIAQTTTGIAFDFNDPDQAREAMLFRDRLMALNTAWWRQRTGDRILLSAHNGHVSYVTDDPEHYPKTQGAFLRELLGRDYTVVGLTFDRGSFNATDENGRWTRTFTVGPARPGSNEHTLDRVRFRDYYVDLRTAPDVVRDWVGRERPTYSIGTEYPTPLTSLALGRSYDIVIHLHRVHRAHPFL